MPEKPRVKAPKKRATPKTEAAPDRRRLLIIAGGAATVLAGVVGAFFLLGAGGSTSPEEARATLQAAGCTLEVKPGLAGSHSVTDPDGTSDQWNTDPPTSGPHNQDTLIYGAYTEPLQLARLLHNLEHGAVYILYGDKVPESTVTELREFYDDHENGTILAPYSKLGNQIALGAWFAEADESNGYLATCTAFDRDAFSAFFDAFQFKGPERFPASSLLPGGN